ncbi:MAG: NADH-quinone oxidoreductase subunit NuoE [Hyphomicrobiales bacterium]
MAVRRLHEEQPESFAFTPDNENWAKEQIGKYPEGRQASAVIPLLWRAQEQHEGWLPEPAIRAVAEMLEMPYIRVLEVATFYTMFQLQPVGKKAHIQVCGTTPCMLRGANDLKDVCRRKIAENQFELSEDGNFSWEEMECLGACVNAPMLQIFKDTYEDLTPEKLEQLIDDIAAGKAVTPGPQNGRHFSVPEGGLTTLVDFDGGPEGGVPVPQVINGATETIDSVAGFALNGGGEKPATAKKAQPKAPAKSAKATSKAAASKAATPQAKAEKAAKPKPTGTASEAAARSQPDDAPEGGAKKPKMLKKARAAGADDLKLIKGIGKVLEDKLNGLGVFHFDQIAAWSDEEVNWVNDHLSFKGRIQREEWIPQARQLAEETKA